MILLNVSRQPPASKLPVRLRNSKVLYHFEQVNLTTQILDYVVW